ncbi:Gfo/Idh/MocA family protein [Salinisphaera sp. LB1]|uniref:Gfo/Idh/MocA family protein n=1 Tax=Salinisphaera sp. LB1 TaxID=2183911 RepID=UPI000D708248
MMRAVLVGCGSMSRAWLQAAAEIDGLAIVGLVDIDQRQARRRAGEFGLDAVVVGDDLDAVLAQTGPDLVFDVVVPSARHQVVSKALAAGCDVLSEKPLAPTLAEARDLLTRADAAQRLHAVVQNRRYIEPVRRLRAFIERGAIGEVTSLHADFFLGPHFGGFREEMPHVLLLDMAIHTLDAGRYLAGDDAVAVYAEEWEPSNSWYASGASAAAIFRLAAGAVFTYRGSWCANGLATSWEGGWRIVGTRGSVVWDGADSLCAEVLENGAGPGLFSSVTAVDVPPLAPLAERGGRVDGHLGVLRDFIDAVNGGPAPETVAHENIKSLAMVLSAMESAETGQRIDITT